jgi:hypothetical protein
LLSGLSEKAFEDYRGRQRRIAYSTLEEWRVVKKLGPLVTVGRLMVWKRDGAAISADAEPAQFQARASAGQAVRFLGR